MKAANSTSIIPESSLFAFVDRLRLINKFILMLFFPVAGMLFFSVSGIMEKTEVVGQMETFGRLSNLAGHANNLRVLKQSLNTE
jgi:hypothetical protein